MAELLPCPFCGGSAVLRHEYTGCGFSYIECEHCGLVSVKFAKSFDRSSDEDAKIYWNRRYTPPSEIEFDYAAEDM